MDERTLQGKTALVTGAARRIGAAIARRLHAAGANVVLHYRGAEAEAAALEAELNAARAGSAAKVKADLLAPIAPKALVGATLERFGRLDVLVNNASTFYPTASGLDRGRALGGADRLQPARAAVPRAGGRAGAGEEPRHPS